MYSTTSAADFIKETLIVKEEKTYDAGVFERVKALLKFCYYLKLVAYLTFRCFLSCLEGMPDLNLLNNLHVFEKVFVR